MAPTLQLSRGTGQGCAVWTLPHSFCQLTSDSSPVSLPCFLSVSCRCGDIIYSSHFLFVAEPWCPARPPGYYLPRYARAFLQVHRRGEGQRTHPALLLRERRTSGYCHWNHQNSSSTDTWHRNRHEGNGQWRRLFWLHLTYRILNVILHEFTFSYHCQWTSSEVYLSRNGAAPAIVYIWPWESFYRIFFPRGSRYLFPIIHCLRPHES